MKSTKTIRLRLLLLLWVFSYSLQAQLLMHKQKGLVVRLLINVTSAPAAGATIIVKNTNRSTTADETGKFTIEASTAEVLVITMVGHVEKRSSYR